MKRLILSLLIAICGVISAKALSYSDARREAWFLTDKMAYELNLTPEQCDVVYEINFDYFLSIRNSRDCRGPYWHFRDQDLRYVLFRWQYDLYRTLDYFFRPIRWRRSNWYYPVCHHYHRDYYFFERPVVYVNYHGKGWSHRSSNNYSPYRNRHFRSSSVGLRDRYNDRDGRLKYRSEHGQSVYTPRRNRDDHRVSTSRPENIGTPGHTARPSRSERPGIVDRNANRYQPVIDSNRTGRDHREGSEVRNRDSYRPSRDKVRTNTDIRKDNPRHSREKSSNSSHERSSREFGR